MRSKQWREQMDIARQKLLKAYAVKDFNLDSAAEATHTMRALLKEPFLDPNNWEQDTHEYRIYADDYANEYVIVDQVDYQYLVQWRWKWHQSRTHKGTKYIKRYLARAVTEIVGKDDYIDGKRKQNRVTRTEFLHSVVMRRTGIPKPLTNQKIIVDHSDGNERNCRRYNLRYATISFNNKNLFGSHANQMDL